MNSLGQGQKEKGLALRDMLRVEPKKGSSGSPTQEGNMIPYSWHCAVPLKEEHTLATLLLPPTMEFMHWSFA